MERKILRPYLVQRCTVKDHPGKSLDGFLNYDYMGSAEFEFGALYKALGQIAKDIDNYDYFMTKEVVHENGSRLCFICHKDFPVGEYVEVLKTIIEIDSSKRDIGSSYEYRMGENRYLLKEAIHFTKNLKNSVSSFHETNVWWDLDNGVFFTFGKDRVKKLFKVLKNSCMRRKSIITKRSISNERFFSGSFNPLIGFTKMFVGKIGFNDIKEAIDLSIVDNCYRMTIPEENLLFCIEKDENQPDDEYKEFIIFKFKEFSNSCPFGWVLKSTFVEEGNSPEIRFFTFEEIIGMVNCQKMFVFKKEENKVLKFS